MSQIEYLKYNNLIRAGHQIQPRASASAVDGIKAARKAQIEMMQAEVKQWPKWAQHLYNKFSFSDDLIAKLITEANIRGTRH